MLYLLIAMGVFFVAVVLAFITESARDKGIHKI